MVGGILARIATYLCSDSSQNPTKILVGLWLESGDCNVSAAGGAEMCFWRHRKGGKFVAFAAKRRRPEEGVTEYQKNVLSTGDAYCVQVGATFDPV